MASQAGISKHALPVAPNLLERRFDGWRPNQAWVSDITSIATGEGWLYLAAILDLASRRIVGRSMSQRMQTDLVCQALRSAYWSRKATAGLILLVVGTARSQKKSPYPVFIG